ncbi:hypothetical protein LUZ60_012882 [Juncus effusus]|nr:hypothetical protein LUZ60_012882 [Juncus effusus]
MSSNTLNHCLPQRALNRIQANSLPNNSNQLQFHGKKLSLSTIKSFRPRNQKLGMVTCAILAADRASEMTNKFNLGSNFELEIGVISPGENCLTEINLKVTNTNNSFVLHWGAIRAGKKEWILPSRRPEGTKMHKNRALRTPFVQSGSDSVLKVEIDDPEIQGIEFLIHDEAQNTWFKNNGENFQALISSAESSSVDISNITIPEDLVQIQAYLRWERNGKQMYSPDQEKEEYEAGRRELQEEVKRGLSLDQLRAKLTKKPEKSESVSKESKISPNEIPIDLVQVQAYIRWEKAGKPNYSPEKQNEEFELARKELEEEVNKGTSIEDLKKKILKGNIKNKVSKQLKSKSYFSVEKIGRKKRDVMQFLTKYTPQQIVEQKPYKSPERTPNALDFFSKAIEANESYVVLNKKVFKIDNKELMVIVSNTSGKSKVHLATDYEGPLILHWALAKNPGEWQAPPASVVPPGSTVLELACETPFNELSLDGFAYKSIEIEIDEGNYKGMPFVLRSDGNWINNIGSDFYVEFSGDSNERKKDAGDGMGTAKGLLDRIAELEPEAERSFMHRFNIAADLISEAREAGEAGLAGILVWLRFMATRQLVWNKNYNVKPREISKAQDRLTDLLQDVYKSQPQFREIIRIILSTVGRGGEGDVGQRIRDEILVIQRNNECKGGMMEEWHQKLHNNTSPDDVIICQALLDYIKSDMDVNVYWETLKNNGITKERLLSYDRAIHSEPNFRRDQKDGLIRDLSNYLRTLKAVHSGADLESAIATCMGYKSEGEGFMVGVKINPISGLPSGFPELLQFVLEHVEDRSVEPLLEGLLEARAELRPLLFSSHDRLKDLLFLDIALDSTVRTAIERGYEELNSAQPQKIMYFITLVLENLALSSDDNEDLLYCLKGWNQALEMLNKNDENWALYAKSYLDRTRLALASKAEAYHHLLQPTAEYLGSLLGVDQWALNIFTEEIIRGGSAASLSMLLNRLDPVLRSVANLGSWQVISPVEVAGYIEVVNELSTVQNKVYRKPTILVAKSVKGEEEIPDGTVAVLTPDMPDVLSHVSVRARNSKVCFATCFDSGILDEFQGNKGKIFRLKPTSSDIIYSEISESELSGPSSDKTDDLSSPSLTLVKKKFIGKYAISAHEFTNDTVGAKSRNIAYLKEKVPSWIGIPTSVALPFGVFEKVLSDPINKEVAQKIKSLKEKLAKGEFDYLGEIRKTVLELSPPPQLVEELKEKMKGSDMPWPGDEGQNRWEQAWMAIKKVWGSKWNERAYFSTRKVKLDHEYLSMAVLVQEIVSADYAFVIHTTNPSSGDESEIYAEVVKGLGETLVGAYPGRALSFVCKKNDLNSPKVLGYPSKPIGLFIKRSIIFRSDSNGEDLEGYAGAGLYDSVPIDEEEKVVLDYSTDPLVMDSNFRQKILCGIANAATEIENLYGTPQDIEGVVKDGKIFVVQTRPQM